MLQGYDIICYGSANWDDTNRVNCHHVMSRLAGRNRVLFLDSPSSRSPRAGDTARVLRKLRSAARGLRRVDEHLSVYAPLIVPRHNIRSVRRLNGLLLVLQARLAERRLGFAAPLLWVFAPYGAALVGHLREQAVVYHCVDNYAANPGVHRPSLLAAERALLARANVVLTTSRTLFAQKRLYNPGTHLVQNVADAAHFATAADPTLPTPADVASLPRPVVGYVGNLASYKVNIPLLVEVARRCASLSLSLALVGPAGVGDPHTDLSALRGLSNVHLLGPREYRDLPAVVKGFDACIIPCHRNESTDGSFPMKFFEYLAAGKPVISTSLPALQEYRPWFYAADTAEDFAAAIGRALAEDSPERAQGRRDLAFANSWDVRMAQVEAIVAFALHQASAAAGVDGGQVRREGVLRDIQEAGLP